MSIDEIRARVEVATPGPWRAHPDGLVWAERPGDPVSGSTETEDAEFIAHARTDVPWLLDRLDQIRRLCENYTPEPPPLFRGPGLSEHGEGYNHGTRDMAAAILGVLAGEEEST